MTNAFILYEQDEGVVTLTMNRPAILNALTGAAETQGIVDIIANALPHMQADRLKALAVSSPARSTFLPQPPTIAEETGLQGFDLTAWGAVFGPIAMPWAIVAHRLSAALARITTDPGFCDWLRQAGVETQTCTADELRTFLDQ
ncbi:tripartite tricarboxylate transporter substrate-binding protein [Ramlibacter sp. H39-3-26]|uniref:tripartite tricarboxylate transporter substrate-binding protein n=1 Tax=Curvibacter soli TaxID=3031331 RepID=UPI0023DC1567|nr:tripartite tricarboxylate transporter substrate-binding protein [Ramlibacter sp. H39-3-26]MDF1486547.1 tripartite tricarboxylate transporter substrate-binding protein [Ramlibacter sp. H39-3-26]